MSTASAPPKNGNATAKDNSQLLQKQMLAGYFDELARVGETGKKVVYTFVPGNLTELIASFGMLPVLPEINALQNAMRGRSGSMVREAERAGHSEDVCSYVKCDVGMLLGGNIGPTGVKLPKPDLLLLSYTGCFTFMKWFEILKRHYDCPVVFLHVPYQGEGEVTPDMVAYMKKQLAEKVVPVMERISGVPYDEDRLAASLSLSAQAEDLLVESLALAKKRPSPLDAWFGGVYYIAPIFTAFRGTEGCIDYYAMLRRELLQRVAQRLGPITPEGVMEHERYRLVVEGPPNWTSFRAFWKLFYDEGAVNVSSTYTRVGGLYDRGFRHDPADPLGSLGRYCLGCYTNLSLPARVDYIADLVREYDADGFVVHSIKSCNSFSAGQLAMLRALEKRTGVPGAFIESDLVDPRYYSQANIKNRLDSYFQVLESRRQGQRSLPAQGVRE